MLAIVHYGEHSCSNPMVLILSDSRVVFVIMMISSLAFYVMAFRVPVVSWENVVSIMAGFWIDSV